MPMAMKRCGCKGRCSLVSSERGFGIIAAIMVLLILAGLGAGLATLSTTQHEGSALDVMGVRAQFLAKSGVEWGVTRALRTASPVCGAQVNDALGGQVDGFTATVQCAALTGGFRITATVCNQPAATGACPGTATDSHYVERKLEVLVDQ